MDQVSELENALGAELLRATLLRAPKPKLGARYLVEDVLGRGASGLVVAAHDDRLGRDVALKLSPATADSGPLWEARALARLDHPNVVRVLDAEELDVALDGRLFRVRVVSMQRVSGRNMRAWLREQRRSAKEIVEVLLAAGAGLAAAHAERIVHRDFKPDNVLVRDDGVAQVIDFGLAVPLRSSVGAATEVAGTGPYLAPEARAGQPTPKSDQFSWGITLVEALVGAATPPARDAPPGVHEQLWRLARRATHPNAARRYADMTTLLAALRRISLEPSRRGGCGGCVALLVALTCLVSAAWRPLGRAYLSYRCAPLAGEWPMRTHVDESRDPDIPVGTEGIYTLTLTHRGACAFDVRLDHTGDDGPEGPHHYRQSHTIRSQESAPVQGIPFPFLPVVLTLEQRPQSRAAYFFLFPTDDSIDGMFEMDGYGGHIVPMSRFGSGSGRDGRSSR